MFGTATKCFSSNPRRTTCRSDFIRQQGKRHELGAVQTLVEYIYSRRVSSHSCFLVADVQYMLKSLLGHIIFVLVSYQQNTEFQFYFVL